MSEKDIHFDHQKDIELIGIGNAIVDIIVNVEDNFLKINDLKKGSMNLIDLNQSELLLKNCEVIKKNFRRFICKYCCLFSRLRS